MGCPGKGVTCGQLAGPLRQSLGVLTTEEKAVSTPMVFPAGEQVSLKGPTTLFSIASCFSLPVLHVTYPKLLSVQSLLSPVLLQDSSMPPFGRGPSRRHLGPLPKVCHHCFLLWSEFPWSLNSVTQGPLPYLPCVCFCSRIPSSEFLRLSGH